MKPGAPGGTPFPGHASGPEWQGRTGLKMRRLAALLAGLVIGIAIIFVVETIGQGLVGLFIVRDAAPGGGVPLGVKVLDLVSWTLGIFGGGLVASLVAGHRPLLAWLVGIVILALAAMTIALLDYPQWITIGAVMLAVVAASLAGRFSASSIKT